MPHAHESRPLFLSFNAMTRDESGGKRRNAILKGEIRDAKKATEDISLKSVRHAAGNHFLIVFNKDIPNTSSLGNDKTGWLGREFSLIMLSLEIDAADESLLAPILVGDNALLGQLRPTSRHLSLASGEKLSQPFKFSARTR